MRVVRRGVALALPPLPAAAVLAAGPGAGGVGRQIVEHQRLLAGAERGSPAARSRARSAASRRAYGCGAEPPLASAVASLRNFPLG